jgi:hypothetical protein
MDVGAAGRDDHDIGDVGLAVQVDGDDVFGFRVFETRQDRLRECAGLRSEGDVDRGERLGGCSSLDRGYQLFDPQGIETQGKFTFLSRCGDTCRRRRRGFDFGRTEGQSIGTDGRWPRIAEISIGVSGGFFCLQNHRPEFHRYGLDEARTRHCAPSGTFPASLLLEPTSSGVLRDIAIRAICCALSTRLDP